VVLYAAVLLCGALAALLVYRYDLYDREPWPALLAAALAGALVMRLAERLERLVLERHSHDLIAAATAALVEELLRLALVVLIAAVLRRTFDDPLDGLVYGSLAGLGMGAEESLALLGRLAERSTALLPVEVVRLLGHLVMGGITGFGVGMARMRLPRWGGWLAGTVAASIALHFAWDLIALGIPASSAAALTRSLLGASLMLAGMLLYGALVVIGSAASREVFAPLSARTLWGWPFTLLPPARPHEPPQGRSTLDR
jgi:RsiW-degrading membrane proteinase PrsW (M82 family)